jgi:hypothetical protein
VHTQAESSAARNVRNRARLLAVTGMRNDGAGEALKRELLKPPAPEDSISAVIMSFHQNKLMKLLQLDTHNSG